MIDLLNPEELGALYGKFASGAKLTEDERDAVSKCILRQLEAALEFKRLEKHMDEEEERIYGKSDC